MFDKVGLQANPSNPGGFRPDGRMPRPDWPANSGDVHGWSGGILTVGHQCFISFKTEDIEYKRAIQTELSVDMIDKSLDAPINSTDEDTILAAIRRDYLSASTVTIHLIGLHSSERRGSHEQRFIKRELQASLYDRQGNSRSGILGVVLPNIAATIYRGTFACQNCGKSHNHIAINDDTVVKEFSYNYYIPNNKCAHTEDERYCVLVAWNEFCPGA